MTLTEAAEAPSRQPTGDVEDSQRVVYLLGAGATQGAIGFRGSSHSLIMPGLIESLVQRMKELVLSEPAFKNHPGLRQLLNDVVDEDTDFEQLITFLEDSRSAIHRNFAAELKGIFSTVLRARLDEVKSELGDSHSDLYAALIDMHSVPELNERLAGILTLNYDGFVEHAIETHLGLSVDYGITVQPEQTASQSIRLLKLHGSFGWADQWPISVGQDHDYELWIPPGIRKAKADYPFNTIWGQAREMLDCDILRIIGCNLGPNDWDLVSMLFTTMHTHTSRMPYRVEVIAGPETAEGIAELFPYLNVSSILEIPDVGEALVSETTGGPERRFSDLDYVAQRLAASNTQSKVRNPFESWLRLKGEAMNRDLRTIATDRGIFEGFVIGQRTEEPDSET